MCIHYWIMIQGEEAMWLRSLEFIKAKSSTIKQIPGLAKHQLTMRDKRLQPSNLAQSIDFKLRLHEHRRSIAAYKKCVGAQSKNPCWQRALQPARASVSVPIELCRENRLRASLWI